MAGLRLRGTKDYFGESVQKFDFIVSKASEIFSRYGCSRISTPIIEHSSLFQRVGEGSDVVSKELYTFRDRSGRDIALVPEGTASVARAVLENNLEIPNRLFYHGPMFRYERPQKGRYRQFHQIGVEFVGQPSGLVDVELISMALHFLKEIGVKANLKINYLGSHEGRRSYILALEKFIKDNLDELCSDCFQRMEKNVLRILDCKVAKCKEIVRGAPDLMDYLPAKDLHLYGYIKSNLKKLDIKFIEDRKLVRGLDYYTNVVFEICDDEGVALLAGGRYDGLYGEMGRDIPATGFACGIERLMDLVELKGEKENSIALIPVDEGASVESVSLAEKLRRDNLKVFLHLDGAKVGKQLKRALNQGVRYAIFMGEDEIKNSTISLKDLEKSESYSLSYEEAVKLMKGVKI